MAGWVCKRFINRVGGGGECEGWTELEAWSVVDMSIGGKVEETEVAQEGGGD